MAEEKNQPPNNQLVPFIQPQGLSLRDYFIAIAVLLAALVVFRFKAIKQISKAFFGGYEGDAGLYVYLMQSNCQDLVSLPWFSTKAFFPYSLTLAWSDNFIFPGMLACPFLKLGLPLVLVYNSILLLAVFLNGLVIFKLCCHLGTTFSAALIFSTTAMLSSTLVGQLGHPQLQFIFFMPLAWLLLFSYFLQPLRKTAFFLGTTICLSFLTTIYYSIYITLSLAAMSCALILLRPLRLRSKELSRLAIFTTLGAAPIVPFLLPYLNVRLAFGARGLHEPAAFAATFFSYLSAPPTNFLYGATASLSHSEAHLFPGLLVLLLSGFAVWRCFWGATPLKQLLLATLVLLLLLFFVLTFLPTNKPFILFSALMLWAVVISSILLIKRLGYLERSLEISYLTNRDLMAVFLLLAVFFFSLSLGPLAASPDEATLLTPYHLLSKLWPGMNSLRATGRLGIVVLLSLVVASALALSFLQKRFPSISRSGPLIFAFCLLEQLDSMYPLQTQTPAPAIVQEIAANQSCQEALLFLPLTASLDRQGQVASWGNFARYNANYMNWAINLPGPIINGYSGQRSKIIRDFPLQMNNFPDLRSIYIAQRIAGLRYVAYISKNNPSFEKKVFEQSLRKYGNHLKLLAIDQDDNYLLKIIGHAPLDEEFFLMVPANNSYQLTFKLQAALSAAQASSITVMLTGTGDKTDLTVPRDGLWHRYEVTVPESPGGVSPNIIRFSQSENETILISSSAIKPL